MNSYESYNNETEIKDYLEIKRNEFVINTNTQDAQSLIDEEII